MTSETYKSGFVALIGRPNSGKSTLINAVVGHKVAITSPVAQTTRKRLRAIITTDEAQIILVDTPGLHKPKDALGKELNRAALGELEDVDIAVLLIDATKEVGRGDEWVAQHVNACSAPYKILALTKADIASPEAVQSQLEAARNLGSWDSEIVLSAKENFNVDAFVSLLVDHLPEGPQWFDPQDSSDATDEETIAEFIREKVLLNVRDEIPHAVAVICNELEWRNKTLAAIQATVLVERESQKAIIIGSRGSMIKKIGQQARIDIEQFLQARVYLELDVRVRPKWRQDRNEIRRLGYDAQE